MTAAKKSAVVTDTLTSLVGDRGILNADVKISDLLNTSVKAVAIMRGAKPGGSNPDDNDNLSIHSGYVFLSLHD